jgi:hypothetical protein
MTSSDRTDALRRALVTTVDAAPFQRRTPRRWTIVAAIAAFALAGAATGGAVAATRAGGGELTPEQLANAGAGMRQQAVGTRAELFGEEFLVEASGATTIDLGERPAGAEAIATSFACVDAGDYEVQLDGDFFMGFGCLETDTRPGGGSSTISLVAAGTHSLKITGPGRFIVWAQWATEDPIPPSSTAQTLAMADGVITRDEYLAGFDRFVACMMGAGYHVDGGNREAVILSYATPGAAFDHGTDERCYQPEFGDIDMTWQIAHQDDS